MHDPEEQSGFDSHVLEEVEGEDVADNSEVRVVGTLSIVVGNTHLPSFILDGEVYVQAPLRLVFEALAEDLSAFVRDLEVRVSDTRRAALSLDRDGRAILSAPVAQQGVGGGRE